MNQPLNGLILLVAACLSLGCSGGQSDTRASGAVREVVTANNAFAWDLYQQLKTTNENLFFSPYSISSSLALTYAGARNRTAQEIAQVLHSGSNDIPAAFGKLDRQLRASSGKIELHLANGLWVQKGNPLLPAFLDTARKQFSAEVKAFDFRTEAEAARTDLNHWISEQTKQQVDALVPPGMLDGTSKLVIANAIYFKGAWLTKFDVNATRAAAFHIAEDRTVTCPMMYGHGKFKHTYQPLCQMLELPYAGKDFSMILLLPTDQDGLDHMERELSPTKLDELMAALEETDLSVEMPKLKFNREYDLGKTLSALGMKEAFNDGADFSGMDGTKSLYISAVRHRAMVDVSEEGTTAAAATVVHLRTKGMRPSFRADHPFIFLIRDNRSGSILFLGRVIDPTR